MNLQVVASDAEALLDPCPLQRRPVFPSQVPQQTDIVVFEKFHGVLHGIIHITVMTAVLIQSLTSIGLPPAVRYHLMALWVHAE